MSEPTVPRKEIEHGRRQLRRLEMLTDVVYGLALVRLFMLLPRPEDDRSLASLAELFTGGGRMAVVVIGFAFTIIFWIQNNAVFGALDRTNNRHTALAIVQLCAVLFFLYAVRMGVQFDGDVYAMLLESCAAAIMGFLGLGAWWYASKNRRLLDEDVTEEDARVLTAGLAPEPITAVLTLPFALIGPLYWTLSWLVLGTVVKFALKKLARGAS